MNSNVKSFKILSGSSLKIIACIAMMIDHFAASIIFYGIEYVPTEELFNKWLMVYDIMRFIGRIAFPIFCFLLVEGFFYTSNHKKYAIRLFIFALISELPFDLAIFNAPISWEYQNVYFELLIGFLTIWAMEKVKFSSFAIPKQFIFAVIGSVLAYILHTDYHYYGIILIVVLYFFRSNRMLQTVAGCISLLWEAPACLAFIPLTMYNGKRGLPLKYFFYVFYPVHLLIYGIILQIAF